MIGVMTLHIYLPGCTSLKEKRGRLKPLLARMHREFNVSVAEMDLQDKWQESVVACALVSNEPAHLQRSLQNVAGWVEKNWLDLTIIDHKIELVS
jgi:uncharacterized protein YlxP (DUF503 family)